MLNKTQGYLKCHCAENHAGSSPFHLPIDPVDKTIEIYSPQSSLTWGHELVISSGFRIHPSYYTATLENVMLKYHLVIISCSHRETEELQVGAGGHIDARNAAS